MEYIYSINIIIISSSWSLKTYVVLVTVLNIQDWAIIIIIIIKSLTVWISLSLSLSLSIRLYHLSLLAGLPKYILCPHRTEVLAGRLTQVGPCVGVRRRTSLMNSLAFPAMSCMSCSSYLDGFRDVCVWWNECHR